ncbi:MAG: hypothetical protein IJ181_12785 [Acidaminococcaceae bacterium]|nr:hypothetical protein [Acidaminococcaceae bacterium]
MTSKESAFTYQGKPFLSIRDACDETGLSMFFIRRGIKEGRIEAIQSGTKYFVNMPRLMEALNALPENRG